MNDANASPLPPLPTAPTLPPRRVEKPSGGRSCIAVGITILVMAGIIIVILPFVALRKLKRSAAMHNAYQIHIGLTAYATANGDAFPNPPNQPTTDAHGKKRLPTSNDAFRACFQSGTIDTEETFFYCGSAWHGGTTPDRNIGTAADGFSKALESGENHYGYVRGLTYKSDPTLPLLMDGGILENPGQWTDDSSLPGGVGKGDNVIVVRVGGSAKIAILDHDFRLRETKGRETSKVNVFGPDYGTNPSDLLNPTPPPLPPSGDK